jgi:arylsulfatase A-like enzyme
MPDSDILSYYKNTTGRYAIPMMIFAPGDTTLTGVTHKTVQQTDLFPTILDMLKYDKPVFAFGENVFDRSTNGLAVHYVNGLYQITKGNFSLLSDGNKPVYLYNNTADPAHKLNLLNEFPEKADSLNTIMKSVLQQYTNRMINNNLLLDN